MTEQSIPRSEEQLPIDIDYAKFLDWLIDRQRIPRNWHTLLKSARTLTRTALSHTPPELHDSLNIPSLEPHQNLPYYTVRKIFQTLTNPSAPSQWGSLEKDLLGRYKSPLHRAWSDALSAFEKKRVYLADAAQQLVRNADVEAPAIKATIAKLTGDIADAVRREGPSIRAAQEARERFVDACNEFSLKHNNPDFETQLREQVEQRVPLVLAAVVETVKDDGFGDALNYYDDVSNLVASGSTNSAKDLCKTVKEVRDGDVNQLTAKLVLKEDTSGIQWGDQLSVDVPAPLNDHADAAEIDWGIEIDASGTAVDTNGESSTVHTTTSTETGINWDLDLTTSTGGIDWSEHITASEAITEENDENNAEAEAMTLADPKARERFLTDLLELDAFLTQRATELSRSAGSEIGLVLQQSTTWPDSIKQVDTERVQELQAAVKRAINGINSDETRRLLALQSNKKRLERAARTIVEKKLVAERMERGIVSLKARRARAGQQLAKEAPKLEELADVTRDAKRWTEEALSGLYRGRCVNILGEINNVFPPVD